MIAFDGVSKWYGAHAAVRDLTFRIEAGEHVGLLGLNGAGKTTTLRMLVGLLVPTSGTVAFEGTDTQSPDARQRIGFLPDRPPLYDEMIVSRYLRFVGELRGVREIEQALERVVAQCRLDEVLSAPIATLSHGYRQRVGVAQAILHEPTLLVLDEPIQGLDPLQIVEMRDLIRDLRGTTTVVLSTHILGEIAKTCDRLLVLHEGRVAAEGTREEVTKQFAALDHHVVLRVKGDQGLVATLEALEGVTAVEVRRRSDDLELEVQCATDLRAELARAVVDAGADLLALETRQSELEQTLRQLREGA
ncbi:MAG: ABC transporter ATP-binding protein [Myxococcota bacterium]